MQIMNLTFNRSFLWSALSLVLIALVLFSMLPSLLRATFTSSPDELEVTSALQAHLDTHDRQMTLYQARFNGRSIFYTPRPTPKPVARPTRVQPTTPKPPEPRETTPRVDPIPPSYTGPSILAIIGQEVWFTNSNRNESPIRIKVGEEKEGIEVVSTDPPWRVKLKYRRGEYDVDLFAVKQFLAEGDDAGGLVPNPPGLIDAPRQSAESDTGDTTAPPGTEGEDKTDKNPKADDESTSKSDARDADNTDTAGTKPGKSVQKGDGGAVQQNQETTTGSDPHNVSSPPDDPGDR